MNKEVVVAESSIQSTISKAQHSLIVGRSLLNKEYLNNLRLMDVLPIQQMNERHYQLDTRLFKVSRIIYENKKNVIESLNAIYSTLGSSGYSVFLYFEGDGSGVDLFIGTTSKPKAGYGGTSGDLLKRSFDGYFAGSKLDEVNINELKSKLNLDDKYSKNSEVIGTYAITAVSGISSSATETQDNFMQGIEKFLDSSLGRKFNGLIIAEYVNQGILYDTKAGYENAYTQLSPLLKQSLSYSEQQSVAIGSSISESIANSFSQSIGVTDTKGTTNTYSENESTGTSESVTKDPGAVFGAAAAVLSVAGVVAAPFTGGASLTITAATSSLLTGAGLASKGILGSKTTGTSTTSGSSYSEAENFSKSESNTKTDGVTNTSSTQTSDTKTNGSSNQTTIDMQNKMVDNLLKKIDSNLERLDLACAFGGWNVASYFIADTETESREIAASFLSLTRGENSSLENYALTTWGYKNKESRDLVLGWLKNLKHPVIKLPDYNDLETPCVSPSTLITGQELAIQLSLPRRSTSSTSVIEVAPYARQVQSLNDNPSYDSENIIKLGCIRHLWKDTTDEVNIDIDSFSSHMLITGTTGVGKTTTLISILAKLHDKKIPFMVIEPAKGEYKQLTSISSEDNKVNYYSAGTSAANALKINPLVFPNGIQLSDHVDRVCNVFNAAFSMYAAMPQVLEEAIYESYEELGWDSITSTFPYGKPIFPTLKRVAELIPIIVGRLGYSEQTSSDYVGSLATRIKSLCRGSLGLSLLCTAEDETTCEQLFMESCIVDLSTMGSNDKRALIMGVLFMRLNEYRMANGIPQNSALRHVTVLEEAHVLLKKTSTDQSMESSNTKGLAIEYFSNALAEMRGYGQGFIIADQSASALDDCVLRNTNTKIIMRAPFEQDRKSLGGALSLTEEQTLQLSKLENYTAVVYQSNWLEPTLCKIQKGEYSLSGNSLTLINKQKLSSEVSNLIYVFARQRNGMDTGLSIDKIKEFAKSTKLSNHLIEELQSNIDNNLRISLNKFIEVCDYLIPDIMSNIRVLSLSLNAQRNHLFAELSNKVVVEHDNTLRLIVNDIILGINNNLEPQYLRQELKKMEQIR